MSLRRALSYGLPASLALWLALIGAGFLTWAWLETLSEHAALDLPPIPQRGSP